VQYAINLKELAENKAFAVAEFKQDHQTKKSKEKV
jgi:hypothetical protein